MSFHAIGAPFPGAFSLCHVCARTFCYRWSRAGPDRDRNRGALATLPLPLPVRDATLAGPHSRVSPTAAHRACSTSGLGGGANGHLRIGRTSGGTEVACRAIAEWGHHRRGRGTSLRRISCRVWKRDGNHTSRREVSRLWLLHSVAPTPSWRRKFKNGQDGPAHPAAIRGCPGGFVPAGINSYPSTDSRVLRRVWKRQISVRFH